MFTHRQKKILAKRGKQLHQTWCNHQEHIYCKDTEPFYHAFMYSLVSLLSGIYPLPTMLSLLVILYVTEYLIAVINLVATMSHFKVAKSYARLIFHWLSCK